MNHGENNSRTINLLYVVIAGLVILIVSLVVAVWATPRVFPQQASAEAQRVDGLFQVLLFIGGAVFFLVEGLLLYSVIRFRRKPGDEGDGIPVHGNKMLEWVWTAIPAITVAFLSIISYNVWTQNQAVRENENIVNGLPVEIVVTGARFNWSFTYNTALETPDGEPIVLRSNVLHVYQGQNVHLQIESNDVNHAFWVPALRLKQDALPGYTTDLRFEPILPGEYPIVCAELCGVGHGNMRSLLIVHPDEETYLSAFFDPAVDFILNPPDDPALLGASIIQTYACQGCHTLDTLGWTGTTGPILNGIGDRAGTQVAGYTAEEYIVESIRLPQSFLVTGYGPVMPQFTHEQMDSEQLQAVVAYLCTQTNTGESACDMENLAAITVESDG